MAASQAADGSSILPTRTMLKLKFPRPEFFDIFGVPVFVTITLLSGWAMTTGAPIARWGLIFLFFVGLFGVLIDGTIVNRIYLKKE